MARSTVRHGKWTISYDPPPLPTAAYDWTFVHDDFDGAPDSNDNRWGMGSCVRECIQLIDEIEDN